MCHFSEYQKAVSNRSSDRRGTVVNAIKGYQRENPLSRLEAAKAALSELKLQLSRNQSLNLKTEVDRAIARLATAPKATV